MAQMTLLEWIPSLGSAAAAVTVVVLFLKHIAEERKSRVSETQKRDEQIIKCVENNTETIKQNSLVLGETSEVLRRINGIS